ncbi:hypothetical protein PR002_g20963 [Phytophthora rubi]|nr:hypothetical protein PR002_g20963 [Phytophthora rubi]
MLQTIRSKKQGDTPDAVHVEYVLREFVGQEQGNAASTFVEDETQLAHVVVFQSAQMKRLYQAFPDVVLADTTHGTNANQYKLFSFVVTDFFGKGQYVQHALVKAETEDNLRLAIKCFQSNNPSWNKVKVFVTEKDFHEKAVLAEAFPGTRQLLCTFQVVTWLEKQVALARHYEEMGDLKDAMEAYEDAGTHQKDIPRMLITLGKIDLLQKYVSTSNNRDLLIWWAQFQESQGQLYGIYFAQGQIEGGNISARVVFK